MLRSSSLVPSLVVLALTACHSDSDSGVLGSPAPIVVNTGLAVGQVFGTGLLRVVAASEAGEGRDLDGDGDLDDHVAQILDLQFKTRADTGLALDPAMFRDVAPPPDVATSDALAVFVVSELATGSDANGNGIPGENTTWIAERATGHVRSLDFAHVHAEVAGEIAVLETFDAVGRMRVFDGSDGSLTTLPVENAVLLLVDEDYVAFTLPEDGAVDLNGDGDSDDPSVLQLYRTESRAIVNTGWATREVRRCGGWLGFLVDEREQGDADLDGRPGEGAAFVALDPLAGDERIPHLAVTGFASFGRETSRFYLQQDERLLEDRNGDGDALDRVPLIYDANRDSVLAPGLAASFPLIESHSHLGIVVDEAAQGAQDLDGDGLASSGVLHVIGASGEVLNLALPGQWFSGWYSNLYAARTERGEDLNGDGDRNDTVLLDWSERTPAGRNVGVAVGSLEGTWPEQALLTLMEFFQGVDANDDGDEQDIVLAAYDASDGRVRSLGIGVQVLPGPVSSLASTAVLVSEQAQGADLNADGDLLDQVLHTVQFVQRID